MVLFESRTLSITIDCSAEKVYEFVSNPENLPEWARNLCSSVRKSDDEWVAETPSGPVVFGFVKRNDFGVLDHYVIVGGERIINPMRVVDNDQGSEVLFTLFRQPGMTDEQYARDIELVEQDLENLKSILEGKATTETDSH